MLIWWASTVGARAIRRAGSDRFLGLFLKLSTRWHKYGCAFFRMLTGQPLPLRTRAFTGGTGVSPVQNDRRDACPTKALNTTPHLGNRLLSSCAAQVLAIALVAAFCAGCPHRSADGTTPWTAPQIQSQSPASGVYHSVLKNETLSAVAHKYHVDLQLLAEVNNLKPPYAIDEGSLLFIPAGSSDNKSQPSNGAPGPAREVEQFSEHLSWPVEGPVTSEFGVREGVQHNGITIQAPAGSPVRSAAEGIIGHVGAIPGYGNVVLIEHANRLVTVYGHLQRIDAKAGKPARQGQVIGTVGTSGRADTPSLYFEVRSRSQPRNPLFFLPGKHNADAG